MYLPLFVGGGGGVVSVFAFVCITLCPFLFYKYLDEEDGAGCFAFIVLWFSCYC